MARPIRIEFPGAYYHVVARGNERKEIFRSDQDRELFLKTLQSMLQQFGVALHCYCLMPNHYHMVVQTPAPNLSQAIGWLQTTYTIRHNRRHKRFGHLFQGRYKAHLIEVDAYALQLIPYIHLNPVRPKDKSAAIPPERRKFLESYTWSSHAYYSGKSKAPEWINLEWLSYWGSKPRQAQREYNRTIRNYFGKVTPSPWEQLRGGLVLGGDKLWEKVSQLIEDKTGHEEIRWKDHRSLEQKRRRVGAILLEESDPRIHIWARVKLAGEKRVSVAREMGYGHGSAVWQVILRLEKAAKQDIGLRRRLEAYCKKCEV